MDFLRPFRRLFFEYAAVITFPVLLGLFLGGLIDHYVPREYVSRLLSSHRKRTVFTAVLLGFLMSACSHGILALSIQIHKKGASPAAVVAFLLAAPWANLAVTVLLFGFFGWGAFFIVLSSMLIAVNTGLLFQVLEKHGRVESNPDAAQIQSDFSIRSDIRRRLKGFKPSAAQLRRDAAGVWAGVISLGGMVLGWILIGAVLASLAGAYVPQDFFHRYMGPGLVGLLVTLSAATVIEICSEGSAPMAFEIFRQTGALGNSFVFLMAGVATDYTEIGLLWQNVGKKTALWLPTIVVPQTLLLGWLANLFM
ncbi:MAG: permease [Candidatus Omnitrophica bacterium]|nr:permease [Candidatus Omnitrophota bacterium]